jgi:hypothetical protein
VHIDDLDSAGGTGAGIHGEGAVQTMTNAGQTTQRHRPGKLLGCLPKVHLRSGWRIYAARRWDVKWPDVEGGCSQKRGMGESLRVSAENDEPSGRRLRKFLEMSESIHIHQNDEITDLFGEMPCVACESLRLHRDCIR